MSSPLRNLLANNKHDMHIHDLVTTVFLAANIIQIDGDALDLGNVSRLNTSAYGADTDRTNQL